MTTKWEALEKSFARLDTKYGRDWTEWQDVRDALKVFRDTLDLKRNRSTNRTQRWILNKAKTLRRIAGTSSDPWSNAYRAVAEDMEAEAHGMPTRKPVANKNQA